MANFFQSDAFLRLTLVLIIFSLVLGGCSFFNKTLGLPDDHLGEFFLEKIIESQLNIEIDLTPGK